jgi:hypothetical protein
LASAIQRVLDNSEAFDARGWALENAGYGNATDKINEALSRIATTRGCPWTRDIAAKKNAPNLRYATADTYEQFAPEYERLSEFLLPLD